MLLWLSFILYLGMPFLFQCTFCFTLGFFFEWRFALHHFIDKMLMLFLFYINLRFLSTQTSKFSVWVGVSQIQAKTIKLMRICKSIVLPEQNYLDWRALNKIFYTLLRSKFWRIFNFFWSSRWYNYNNTISYIQILHYYFSYQKI